MWTLVGCTLGCEARSTPAEAEQFLRPEALPGRSVEGRFLERDGPGRLLYLGSSYADEVVAGSALALEHVFEVQTAFSTNPLFFVHGELRGGPRVAVDDHGPIGGAVPLSKMKAGQRWVDQHALRVPEAVTSGTLELFVGLFDGEVRMTLETAPGLNDGRDRLKVGSIKVRGRPPEDLPVAHVAHIEGPIRPDGKLDEAEWTRAQPLAFSDSLGRARSTRFPTRLRLLYDDTALYVGFEADDQDISERYENRDDPIYEHETVELFLMPGVRAPELGPYVELQASPTGVIFDASFTGPRRGMNKRFDALQEVGTSRDGTLNDDTPDRGWISEWRLPFSRIRGVKAPPQPGEEWRMNAFRIEKFHEDGHLQGEYTAWSPPKVGDFHAVARFGRLVFGPKTEGER